MIVSEVPKRSSKFNTDWDSFAMLAKSSGLPVLAAERLSNSRIKSLRQYTRAPFVQPDGRIVIQMRNSQVEADGIRYGDLYFTWVPTQED